MNLTNLQMYLEGDISIAIDIEFVKYLSNVLQLVVLQQFHVVHAEIFKKGIYTRAYSSQIKNSILTHHLLTDRATKEWKRSIRRFSPPLPSRRTTGYNTEERTTLKGPSPSLLSKRPTFYFLLLSNRPIPSCLFSFSTGTLTGDEPILHYRVGVASPFPKEFRLRGRGSVLVSSKS